MEITTLLGKFLQSISKNIYDDSEQSKELIEQLTQIANIYNSGKNNTELINSLKSITKEFGQDDKELKENDREEGEEKEEEALKEPQPESQERELKELQPEHQERELEEPQPEFQERTLEGKREEDNEEEKIDLKPFDWKAFVYDSSDRRNAGLNTRYYNNDNGYYIGGAGNIDEIENSGTDSRTNRDIVRDKEKFQILLTTQKLAKVHTRQDRGSKGCFTISVTEEELARLKLSEDMELKLENGKDLVNTLDSIVHSNDPGDDRTIRNQKVLIPFTNKKLEVSSIDIEMAHTIMKVLRFLDSFGLATNRKAFNILFDGNSLDMEQTIKIANIFSKLPIKFQIRHCNGRNYNMAIYEGTMIIGSPEIANKGKDILTLDVKDGVTTEKNISELERFLREDSHISWICERANEYRGNIDYWKNAKRKDGLPLTDEDKEYVQSKIKETEEKLKKYEVDYEIIQALDQEIQKLYEKLKPTQNKDTQSLKKMSGMALREGISRQDTDMAKQEEHEHKKDGAEYE